jgi:hypothetical protein
MIVLSVGMPRAGSGWHYNLVHDLMETTGCADARDIRARYRLERILTEVNCNIGVLSARRLALVALPALVGNTFVIKAHAGPSSSSRLLQRLGLLRITYIYRYPRDAMLSAYDFILEYVRIWEKWMKEKNVLVARYEDLLTDYDREVAKLVTFLKLNANQPGVQKVVDHYRPGASDGQQGLHFYKGKIGRFREAYTAEEQTVLKDKLGVYLQRMGYEL